MPTAASVFVLFTQASTVTTDQRCRSSSLVKRISYLANKDYGMLPFPPALTLASLSRSGLHEIHFTKSTSPDNVGTSSHM